MKGCINIERLQFSSNSVFVAGLISVQSLEGQLLLIQFSGSWLFVNFSVLNLFLAYSSCSFSVLKLLLLVDWTWSTAELPPSCLFTPPPTRLGERIRREKPRKLVGSDKDSVSEGKRSENTQVMQKVITGRLPQADWWPASLRTGAALERSSSQFLLLSTVLPGMGYTFGQFGPAIAAVFPPSLSPSPSLLVVGCSTGGNRKFWCCASAVQQ